MKKRTISLYTMVVLLSMVFVLGFICGRNSHKTPVLVSVPEKMQTLPSDPPETTEEEITFPINLNTAGREELMALPGIGEKLSLRILAYRRERGRFWHLSDLLKIEGMTQKKLDDIQDLVILGG